VTPEELRDAMTGALGREEEGSWTFYPASDGQTVRLRHRETGKWFAVQVGAFRPDWNRALWHLQQASEVLAGAPFGEYIDVPSAEQALPELIDAVRDQIPDDAIRMFEDS